MNKKAARIFKMPTEANDIKNRNEFLDEKNYLREEKPKSKTNLNFNEYKRLKKLRE